MKIQGIMENYLHTSHEGGSLKMDRKLGWRPYEEASYNSKREQPVWEALPFPAHLLLFFWRELVWSQGATRGPSLLGMLPRVLRLCLLFMNRPRRPIRLLIDLSTCAIVSVALCYRLVRSIYFLVYMLDVHATRKRLEILVSLAALPVTTERGVRKIRFSLIYLPHSASNRRNSLCWTLR